jgi:hypothetical protein
MPIIITKIIGEWRSIFINTLSLALYCFLCLLNNELTQNVFVCFLSRTANYYCPTGSTPYNNSTKSKYNMWMTPLALYNCNYIYVNYTKITLSMLWYKVTKDMCSIAVILSYNLSM